MPDTGLVSRRAGELEHHRIALTASLDLFRIGIITRHL